MASSNQNVEPSYYRQLARLSKVFTYQELVKATNNFSNILGEGGSGSVFEGYLKDGTPIAVKRIKWSEHCKIFFEGEVSTIASLHHINLVRLQGFCSHEIETGGDSYIVYDLQKNGSLDTWIFSKKGRPSIRILPWKLRYQVAINVAKALIYLHDDCRPPIIHFDVKPANVLLDDNFGGVLADFGLSVMTKKDGCHTHSISVKGTRGYIAPEIVTNKSSKADMYSFGKVLLDMFFGQVYVCLDINGDDIYKEDGNTLSEERTFHNFLQGKLKNNEIMHLADKRLKKNVNEAEANTLVDVALRCAEEDPTRRPWDMGEVLQLLEHGQQDKHEYRQAIDDTQRAIHILEADGRQAPKPVPVKRSETFSSQQSAKHQIIAALKDNKELKLFMASSDQNVDPSYYWQLARLPKVFTYEELVKATNNFSNMLGEGASGSVFKGCLEDGTPIAVKRIEWSENCKIFFEGEVSTIASLDHKNLVGLQGFCSHEIETGGYSYIAYNLQKNGSLDTWIFSKKGRPNDQILPWKLRYQVAMDVAQALIYLHVGCRTPIVHFDVKPANVLLDDNFSGLLADFGLSVLTKKDGSHMDSISGRGTRGYIAPEMVKNNEKSYKSDMYSFGKVLLDMFFGEVYVCLDINGVDIYNKDGNTLSEERTFHNFLREKLKNDEIIHLADMRLKKNVNEAEANTLVDVALRCAEEDPTRRPRDMKEVLQLLEHVQQDQHEYHRARDDTQRAIIGQEMIHNERSTFLKLIEDNLQSLLQSNV